MKNGLINKTNDFISAWKSKNKNRKFIIIVIIIVLLYGMFILFDEHKFHSGGEPTLTVPTDVITISVKNQDKELLKGVSAMDKEDGDLTSKVFIESKSQFNENNERTITYAVFDSDDHITRKARKIKYSDYKLPKLSLKKPLCYFYINSEEELATYMAATSNVDGDISSKVVVEKILKEGKIRYAVFSVTDSCGGKDKIKLRLTEVMEHPLIDINLKEIFLRVPKGTKIDPLSYVKDIEYMGIKYNSLISKIEVESDYNPNKKGVYEFIYYVNRSNDYGITKLVVVVE